MVQKNPQELKGKILSSLKNNGPSLPVQIAKAAELETLFAGAFLSELAGEKSVKISHMKVGGSPLYFLPGQEEQLENFSNYIKGKEKEAFLMLKEKKVLVDSSLEPAIRVALRALKDFALPIIAKENESRQVFWRFHSLEEKQAIELIKELNPDKTQKKIEILTKERQLGENIMEDIKKEKTEISSPESRFEKLHPELTEKKEIEPSLDILEEKIKKPKITKDAFLQEVQNILTKKNMSIVKAENFDKKEVIIRAVDKEEILVFAFNKKKITDKELIKCYKKALALKLPYVIFIKDEISKKMKETIDASKSLLRIDKLA